MPNLSNSATKGYVVGDGYSYDRGVWRYVPITPAGKTVASILALFGIGIVAMPAGNFNQEMENENETKNESNDLECLNKRTQRGLQCLLG